MVNTKHGSGIGSGKLPSKIQTFIPHLLHNMRENNFNQNNGTKFDFNLIDANEVSLAVLF